EVGQLKGKTSHEITVKGDHKMEAVLDARICELREQMTELQAVKFEQETQSRKLEAELAERQADLQRALLDTEQFRELMTKAQKEKAELEAKNAAASESLPANLTKQERKRLQEELEKLQDLLKDAEVEKTEKEAEIKELQDVVKEYKQKMGTLKRNQQTEKKKNAQLLEEARKREDSITDESSHLSSAVKKSSDRVEELEEALRQSVIITAEREMAMADLQGQIEDAKTTIEELQTEVDSLHQGSQKHDVQMTALSKELEDKNSKIQKLTSERQKHMQEVYEMKQEAIQAAISEKDSMLALLEMTSIKNQKNMAEIDRLMKDKRQLQVQLRDVTSKRMKLMHWGVSHESHGEGRKNNTEKVVLSKRSISANNSPTRYAPPPQTHKTKSAGSSPIEDERVEVTVSTPASDSKTPPPSTGVTPTGGTPPAEPRADLVVTIGSDGTVEQDPAPSEPSKAQANNAEENGVDGSG
ncbi:Elks/rab6-interacting/cast family member 1, partial [Plakobranchus ocellatus]